MKLGKNLGTLLVAIWFILTGKQIQARFYFLALWD